MIFYRNMGHFLCSVERIKRFVNVHLHCIVSNVPTKRRTASTTFLFSANNSTFCFSAKPSPLEKTTSFPEYPVSLTATHCKIAAPLFPDSYLSHYCILSWCKLLNSTLCGCTAFLRTRTQVWSLFVADSDVTVTSLKIDSNNCGSFVTA